MKLLVVSMIVGLSIQVFAGEVILRPDGDKVNINGTQVSCARGPLNISPVHMSDAGLYAMLLSGQLGKCQAKTSSEYVVSAKEESKVGTLDVRIHGDSNYSVVYSAVGPQGSDGIFEPSANQLKQIANLLKDFIKAGICK